MVRDDITTSLAGAQVVGNTVMRVMADAMAGLTRLILKYIDWLSLQLMPDSAEREWLDRHGIIWLQNSDGTLGRKGAQVSSGTIGLTGTPGIVAPEGTAFVSPNGVTYMSVEDKTLDVVANQPTEVAVQAINPGTVGNLPVGTFVTLTSSVNGLDSTAAVVDLRGGTDVETDDALRARVLFRIRQPPMGGDADDYVGWTMSIPFVTRAWAAPRELGMGTVTIRFMCDALRPETGGFPLAQDIAVVQNYLNTVRPVAVRDFFVMAPVPEPINFNLSLMNDSLALRTQVETAVSAMITEKAMPAHANVGQLVAGTTIPTSWVAEAINRVTNDYDLTMDDHPMPHNGALAVLGVVTYPTP
jgi:uncharacterized phage protein gp47/JayE